MGEPNEHRPFTDFDAEVRISDIAALNELANALISENSLSEWARDSLSRHALLGEVAFFSIRWDRGLGLPHAPTPASAFSVQHDCWVVEGVAVGGGAIVDKSHWGGTGREPLLFPGAVDGDDYVINVLVYPVFFWVNRIRVGLIRPDWDGPAIEMTPAGFKVVTPSEQYFQYLRQYGPPVVLEDVRVINRPYLMVA